MGTLNKTAGKTAKGVFYEESVFIDDGGGAVVVRPGFDKLWAELPKP